MAISAIRSRTSPARGRPRSESARRAVLEAAGDLLEKNGYRATTIEAIAARAGVAKTTIYRWWSNRAALVVELLLQRADEAAPPAIVGKDPVRGLYEEMQRVARAAQGDVGRMLLSLLGEAQHDDEVRAALVKGLFGPRRAATAEVVREAQTSGRLRPEVSPPVIGDLLFGPIFYRRFIRQEPVSTEYVREVFEAALTGLTAAGRTQRRARRARPGSGPAARGRSRP
jgi:AcrR family transcriptional regulator